MAASSLHFSLAPVDNDRLANLCGIHDGNIKALGEMLDVRIQRRGEHFRVFGDNQPALRAQVLLRRLYDEADPDLLAKQLHDTLHATDSTLDKLVTGEGVAGIRARNQAQADYLDAIRTHDITFGVGASGTGKTFLAIACALEALDAGEVKRIVLVRPAVEAGESLGFLPGDPVQKVHPYLRPLQDAMQDITQAKQLDDHLRNARIELAPLAFMRGRTLAASFVILDEAQNSTKSQMLMFLTRLGQGSRCVVTGDETQVDLPRTATSGLIDVLRRVDDIAGCAVVRFRRRDTMRHPVVERILQAYADD